MINLPSLMTDQQQKNYSLINALVFVRGQYNEDTIDVTAEYSNYNSLLKTDAAPN